LRLAAVALAVLVLAGCSGKSEEDFVKAAESELAAGKPAAAVQRLKSALQARHDSPRVRMLMGRAMVQQGESGAAAVEFQKALDAGASRDEAVPPLAESLLASGQLKLLLDTLGEARLDKPAAMAALKSSTAAARLLLGEVDKGEQDVREALAADPASLPAQLLQARLLAGRRSFDEALALVDKLAAAHPKRAEVSTLRGELLYDGKRDPVGAAAAFRQAQVDDPRYLSGHTGLLRLLLEQHDLPAFRTALAALKKIHPNSAEARFYDARDALMTQDIARAREAIQQLMLAAPENAYVQQLAGAIEFEAGALVPAEARLTKALNLAPQLTTARVLLAETHLRAAQPAKALAVLRPLLELPQPGAAATGLAAQAHLQLGNAAQAERLYLQAAKIDPADPKTRVALALVQMQLGRVGAAMADLEQAAASSADTYADLALYSARLRHNDTQGALKAALDLERKLQGKPLPQMLQGQALLQAGATADARARFDKALQLDPAHVPAASALADLDLRDGKPAQALTRFEALHTRDPRNPALALAVAQLRLRTGQPADAVATFLGDVVRQHPAEIAPRMALVDLLLAQHKNEAALSAAQAALSVFPDQAQALDSLGRVQLAAGATEQAVSTFRKAAAAYPQDTRPWLRLADAYVGSQNLRAAEQSLRKALEIEPRLLAAQRGLLMVALQSKRTDEALKLARTVQAERPTEAIGHVFEAEIHVAQRAWDAALKSYQTALDRSRSSEVARAIHAVHVRAGHQAEADRFAARWMKEQPADGDFLLHIANLAIEAKNFPQAEVHFRALQDLRPDSPTPPNNLAWLLVQQGKPGALPLAERAAQLQPDNAAVLDTLALVLASEKQWPRAAAEQQKAVNKAPVVSEYRLRLAKYLIAAGDKAAARNHLQKLVADDASGASQAEARSLLGTL
jgi:putative PEP-CTERM system TPR-repeat lipoprotein